jgi:hypothetical protein
MLAILIPGFGSGSGSNLDSIRSVYPDPDPFSESGSRSKREKMTHKSRINLEISYVEVLDVLFRAEHFFQPIFGHKDPGSGSVLSLKCWIRIRIK